MTVSPRFSTALRVTYRSASRTPKSFPIHRDRARARRPLLFAAMVCLLSGCAANNVTTLLKASKQTDTVTPSATMIQEQLKGHTFEVGSVGFDLHDAADKQGPDIPDRAYRELLRSQLEKAFSGARLGTGVTPAYPVNVTIEELKLKPALFLIPQLSTCRVRMEIVGTNGEALMRGHFQSSLPPPMTTVIASGVVAPIALPATGWEYVALARTFPAVAIVIAATAQGLQEGKALEEIRVYPEDIDAAPVVNPNALLKNASYGMTQISAKEIDQTIKAAQAPEVH